MKEQEEKKKKAQEAAKGNFFNFFLNFTIAKAVKCNYNADCASLGDVGQYEVGKWMCPGLNQECKKWTANGYADSFAKTETEAQTDSPSLA